MPPAKGFGTKAKSMRHRLPKRTAPPVESNNGKVQKITFDTESIGPELAMEYLKCVTYNRTVVQGRVDKFARDMQNGRWVLTHQGIAFDWNGDLADGEHRLWAVVQCGCTIEFIVSRGWDPAAREWLDQGANRSTKDALQIKLASELNGEKISRVAVAIGRKLMVEGANGSTRHEQMQSYLDHREAIEAIMKFVPTRRVKFSHVSLLTPIVRAWYQPVYREKIARFMEVLISGLPTEEEEKVIIQLRNLLLMAPSLKGVIIADEIYWKTEKALYLYMKGEKVQKLYSAQKELFPLPLRKG